MSTSTMSTVTERVTDVLSTRRRRAAGRRRLAVEQFESLPDRVADLTGSQRQLVVAAAVAVRRRRRVALARRRLVDRAAPPHRHPRRRHRAARDGANPVRSHTDRAVAAATGQ